MVNPQAYPFNAYALFLLNEALFSHRFRVECYIFDVMPPSFPGFYEICVWYETRISNGCDRSVV